MSLPFWYSGSRAILIFDKDEPDLRGRQLANEWGRWLTRRSLVPDIDDSVDVVEFEAAIARACQTLTKHQTIKGCHSAIKNKADEAGLHVAALVDEVDPAMTTLEDSSVPAIESSTPPFI